MTKDSHTLTAPCACIWRGRVIRVVARINTESKKLDRIILRYHGRISDCNLQICDECVACVNASMPAGQSYYTIWSWWAAHPLFRAVHSVPCKLSFYHRLSRCPFSRALHAELVSPTRLVNFLHRQTCRAPCEAFLRWQGGRRGAHLEKGRRRSPSQEKQRMSW